MKKLPKIYQADLKHKIENNEKVFYSKNETAIVQTKQNSNNKKEYQKESVEEDIASLFQTTGYVFNIPVEIKTKNKTLNTNIAGKVKNTIITLDNDVIPISDIVSIKRKDR